MRIAAENLETAEMPELVGHVIERIKQLEREAQDGEHRDGRMIRNREYEAQRGEHPNGWRLPQRPGPVREMDHTRGPRPEEFEQTVGELHERMEQMHHEMDQMRRHLERLTDKILEQDSRE